MWQYQMLAIRQTVARFAAARLTLIRHRQMHSSGRLPVRTLSTPSVNSELQAKFDAACAAAGPRLAKEGSPGEKLEAYALFKQATLGDVSGARPGLFDIVARAKYDGWAALKGTAKDAAMQAYIKATTRFHTNGALILCIPRLPVHTVRPRNSCVTLCNALRQIRRCFARSHIVVA